jgi:hypothetical protein
MKYLNFVSNSFVECNDTQSLITLSEFVSRLPIFHKALLLCILKLLVVISENSIVNASSIKSLANVLSFEMLPKNPYQEQISHLFAVMISSFRSMFEKVFSIFSFFLSSRT